MLNILRYNEDTFNIIENCYGMLKKALSKTTLGWLICAIGAMFYCYEYLLRIAPAAMLTPLMREFHLHAEALSMVISLFYLAYSPMQLFVGLAHDIFGPHRILTMAVGCCLLGSLLFGLATSPLLISVARLLIGFGSAFAFVGALKLGSLWLPKKHFALFVGLTISIGMLGGIFGNIAITALVKYINWRHIYLYGAALGAVLMAAMWWIVSDNTPKLKLHLTRIIKRSQTRKHLLRLLKNHQLWLLGVIASLLYLSLSALAELWGNRFVQQAYGLSMEDAAITNTMIFLGWLIGAPTIGWLSGKLGQRRILILINAFLASAVCIVILFFPPTSAFVIKQTFFLLGIFCSAQTLCITMASEKAPMRLNATAIGFINCIVMLGGLIFQPLIGHLLDAYWLGTMQHGIRVYSEYSFRIALSVLPIGFFIAGVLSFFTHDRKKSAIAVSYKKV